MKSTAPKISQEFSNLGKYIGRDYEKVNCWDLVREFYLSEFCIELQKFYEGFTPNNKEVVSLIQSNKGYFDRVEIPTYGDLILLKIMGLECHIGIFINETKFLHTLKGTGSVLDNLERYGNRIVGFYRHRGRDD